MRSLTSDRPKSKPPALTAPIPTIAALLHPWSLPLLLVVVLSVLAGTLAYQAPPAGSVRIGWPGDRLFLNSDNGLSAAAVERGDFFPDDLTPDSPTGRSRWTRQHARLVLPNLGAGSDLRLTLVLQGWPADVRDPPAATVQGDDQTRQPEVALQVDGRPLTTLVPTARWQSYSFRLPATMRQGADLRLDLTTSATFTATERGPDPRPKGIRLAEVRVAAIDNSAPAWLPPAWQAVLLLTLVSLLLYVLLIRLLRSVAWGFLLTMLCTGATGAGLALLRIWMGAALAVMLCVLVVALVIAWQRPLLRLVRLLLQRYTQGRALNYGLVMAALAWLGYEISRGAAYLQQQGWMQGMGIMRRTFPDSLLFGMLSVGVVALVLVLGREGLPRIADRLADVLNGPRAAPIILMALAAIWLGYEAVIIAALPYVGHADYADNAVVARNLADGRGWVVDYVTQFYALNDGLTRPQETWPLLQPLWMAPFVALFGPVAWAAKMPNLVFMMLLLLLVYKAGEYLWDRRVGLTAAMLTLTSHLFFNLAIYTTSDLGFVVFSMAAIYLMYRAVHDAQQPAAQPGNGAAQEDIHTAQTTLFYTFPYRLPRATWYLLASGVVTGLMMLQKPSGALIAVGIGLWYIFSTFEFRLARLRWLALHFAAWAGLALVVLSPYLARNLALFGTPVYSTESYDAWVLGYRGNSGDAWNDIYRVFAPELGGPGLPDRSWVLRWGFDYTYAKFQTQVDAVRDYLMPAWPGLPALVAGEPGQPWLFSSNEDKNLLMPMGAWLSLIGVIAALWARRRLLFLLVLAFAPYTAFLLTYWRTNEERYFLMAMPWLFLLAAWVIWAGYERLAAVRDRRWSPLALILVGVTIVAIVQPSWERIAYKVQHEPQKWAPDVAAYNWIEEHISPGTVMMTRNPWQLNWHAQRPAVMIPNTNDQDLFFGLANYYDAEYIVFENLQRVKGESLAIVGPLANARDALPGEVIEGFELVYASPTETNRTLIYRFPAERNDYELSIRDGE